MECIFVEVMNEALISIGSNENREYNICACQQLLNKVFVDIKYSSTSITIPYGIKYKDDFLNQLAIIYTNKNREEITSMLKSIEKELGRKTDDKITGCVVIDIDLIVWNNEILKPDDMKRQYVSALIPTIC